MIYGNYLQEDNKPEGMVLPSTYEVPGLYHGKPVKVGFSGSHRTGKTITAIEVAKKLDIQYVNANVSASDIWTSFSPSDSMTFGERIQVQEFLLDEMEKLLTKISNMPGYVIDRTPIDVLSYLLANIDNTTSSIFDVRGQAFIERCIELSAKHFTHYVVIPPSIPFVAADGKMGKVYNSKTYQESLTNIIIGAYYRYFEKLNYSFKKTLVVVPDYITKLDMRIEFVASCIGKFQL